MEQTHQTSDHYLKQLNKLSHKISKPNTTSTTNFTSLTASSSAVSTVVKRPSFDQTVNDPPQQQQPQQQPPHQHQPPVYNINKNDFRDVVQKLTGSPAHERISTPPPIQPPKAQSSRLQRIRPPPLAHVSSRPPNLLSCAVPPPNPNLSNFSAATSVNPINPTAPVPGFTQRPLTPLSPLPPFPAIHAAAESPISAYMRYIQTTISGGDANRQFSGFSPLAPLGSPGWNAQQQPFSAPPLTPPPLHPQQSVFQLPTSPLPFGCLNSPISFPLSPSLFPSPSSFPLSPTVPVPSPTWRGH